MTTLIGFLAICGAAAAFWTFFMLLIGGPKATPGHVWSRTYDVATRKDRPCQCAQCRKEP